MLNRYTGVKKAFRVGLKELMGVVVVHNEAQPSKSILPAQPITCAPESYCFTCQITAFITDHDILSVLCLVV